MEKLREIKKKNRNGGKIYSEGGMEVWKKDCDGEIYKKGNLEIMEEALPIQQLWLYRKGKVSNWDWIKGINIKAYDLYESVMTRTDTFYNGEENLYNVIIKHILITSNYVLVLAISLLSYASDKIICISFVFLWFRDAYVFFVDMWRFSCLAVFTVKLFSCYPRIVPLDAR